MTEMNKENEQLSQIEVTDVLCDGKKLKIFFTERLKAEGKENNLDETENMKNKNSLNVNRDTAEKSPEKKVQQLPYEGNGNIEEEDNSLIDLMQDQFQGFMKEKYDAEEKYLKDIAKLKNSYKEKKIKLKDKFKGKKEKLRKNLDNSIQNSKNKFKKFFNDIINKKIKIEQLRSLNELKNLIESNKFAEAMTLINKLINNNFRDDSLLSDNSSDNKAFPEKGKFGIGNESSGENNEAKKE
jgi:hypothetical protein